MDKYVEIAKRIASCKGGMRVAEESSGKLSLKKVESQSKESPEAAPAASPEQSKTPDQSAQNAAPAPSAEPSVAPSGNNQKSDGFEVGDANPVGGMTVVDDKGNEIKSEDPKIENDAQKEEPEENMNQAPPLPELDENGNAIIPDDNNDEDIDVSQEPAAEENPSVGNESNDQSVPAESKSEDGEMDVDESMGQMKNDLAKSEAENEESKDSRFSEGDVATEFDPEMKDKYVNNALFDSRIEQMNKFVHIFDDIEGRKNNVTFKAIAANLDWSNLDDVKAFKEHCDTSGVDGSEDVLAFIYHNYNEDPESLDKIIKKME